MSLFSGLPAIVTTKAAAAAVAATLTVVGGVAAKAAATGDPNPLNWGSTVTQQVQTCKADLTAGQHGIGQCVSNTAKQNGANERNAHSQGQTPPAHPTGKPDAAPTPPSHPTGAPDTAPTPPTGAPSAGSTPGAAPTPPSHPTGRP